MIPARFSGNKWRPAGGAAIGALAGPVALMAGIAGVAISLLFVWRSLKRRQIREQRRAFYRDPARREIFAVYRSAQKQLRARRAEAQTVRDHARQVPELDDLAALVEIAAYRPVPPDAGTVAAAKRWRLPKRG